MSAKDNLRKIALKNKLKLPDDIDQLYNSIVEEVHTKAIAGFFGCGFTINLPIEYSDYLPHLIGDLREGGLVVDVVGVSPEKRQTVAYIIITW